MRINPVGYVKRFMKEFPEVHVHVEYRRSNQVYEDVLGKVVDLGFVAYGAAIEVDQIWLEDLDPGPKHNVGGNRHEEYCSWRSTVKVHNCWNSRQKPLSCAT